MHNGDKNLCLELSVTHQCNMHCPHCAVAAGDAPAPKLSSAQLADTVEQLAKKYNVVNVRVTGGEPLLFSGLQDVLKAARNSGGRVVLETNSTLVTEDFARQVAGWVDLVGISLDSLTRHGTYRGLPDGTRKAMDGIRTFVDAGCYTQIATTVMDWNKSELPDIVEFACSVGVKRVRLLPNIVTAGRGSRLRSKSNASHIKKMYDLVFEIAERYSDRMEIASNIPIGLIPLRLFKNKVKLRPGVCNWHKMIAVMPDGALTLCASVTAPELVARDAAATQTLDDIGTVYESSPFFQAIREIRENLTGICGQCVYRGICGGYCRVYAHSFYGSLDAPFPPCQILYDAGLFPKACLEKQFAGIYEEQGWLH